MNKPRSSRKTGLSHLRVTLSDTAYIGPGRADLLELIDATRSISAAGRQMGMSYKRAWGLVQALNQGFGRPLVVTSRGGSHQGGAELTALGREVLVRYRSMQQAAEQAIQTDFKTLQALVTSSSSD